MRSKDFYRPNLPKTFHFVIFLIFLPLQFLLFVIPPLFAGILFYPYLFSAFTIIGFPAMIGSNWAYVGFFFSVIYLTAMVFLVYWAVCFLYNFLMLYCLMLYLSQPIIRGNFKKPQRTRFLKGSLREGQFFIIILQAIALIPLLLGLLEAGGGEPEERFEEPLLPPAIEERSCGSICESSFPLS